MDRDPTHVVNEDLQAALESLGIGDFSRIRRIEIEPGRITVTRNRIDGGARPFHTFPARGAATEITEIALQSAKDVARRQAVTQ